MPQRTMSKCDDGVSESGGAVRGVREEVVAAHGLDEAPERLELRREQVVAGLVGGGEMGHQARRRSAAPRAGAPVARSLVPSRPIPVSSFTCTRGAARCDLVRSRRPRRHPPPAPRAAPSRVSAPITRTGASTPCSRSSRASPAVATASQVAPPASAAPATRPVPVTVRLDHRAQRLRQPGAVALDGAEVDLGERAIDAAHAASAPSTSTRVTTPTRRPSSTTGRRL